MTTAWSTWSPLLQNEKKINTEYVHSRGCWFQWCISRSRERADLIWKQEDNVNVYIREEQNRNEFAGSTIEQL
jgi:hypothetical protein